MAAAALERWSDSGAVLKELADDGVTLYVHPGGLPLLVQARDPQLAENPDSFVRWFAGRKEIFDRLAAIHGAIRFRGFPLRTTADFQRVIHHYPSGNLTYVAGGAPRSEIAERVFEATQAGKELYLIPHQEMAYLPNFPRMICFFSRKSAWAGGETFLLDFRELEHRLPRRLWDKVKACGVRYERNFRSPDGEVSPLRARHHKSWPAAFGSNDPKVAEAACRAVGLDPVWQADGSLSTYYTAPGFIDHPLTGQNVWFNHIGAQSMSKRILGPERWRAMVEERPPGSFVPNTTLYGDGSEIDQEDLDQLYSIFEALSQALRWQDGDLLLIDNIMTAHGRNPYEGERDLQVALLG